MITEHKLFIAVESFKKFLHFYRVPKKHNSIYSTFSLIYLLYHEVHTFKWTAVITNKVALVN